MREGFPIRQILGIASIARSEKIRFLVVGIWNAIAGFLIFLALNALAGKNWAPVAILVLSYCISVPHAFLTQRLLVFRVRSPWPLQFARFASAHASIFVANVIFLPLAIALTHANSAPVQACFLLVSAFVSYVAHKYFSFAR